MSPVSTTPVMRWPLPLLAVALNIPLEKIAAGFEMFGGVSGVYSGKTGVGEAVLIDDTYNASASFHAAISVLAQAGGKARAGGSATWVSWGRRSCLACGDWHGSAACRYEKLYALGTLSDNAVREFGRGAQHFEGN